MVVPQDQTEGGIRPDVAEMPRDTLTDRLQCPHRLARGAAWVPMDPPGQ